jgi:hypothetical protein
MAGFPPRRERWDSLNVLAVSDAVFVSPDLRRKWVRYTPLTVSPNWVQLKKSFQRSAVS